MAQAPNSSPPAETVVERLAIAVERLTEHVRVLTAFIEDTRQELQWIARNGIPHQTLTVRIEPKSGALPTAADDGTWKVQVTAVDDAGGKLVTEFVGQDIDLRCVRMTALNLAFRNLYGYVIWGNTLALEQKLIYRTGFDGQGFLREVPLTACPTPVQQVVQEATPSPPTEDADSMTSNAPSTPKSQLRLF